MTDNITGKVIVITGASSGMGEATARDLAAQGAKVVLGARRADRLDAIVRDITEAGAGDRRRHRCHKARGRPEAGRHRQGDLRPRGRDLQQCRSHAALAAGQPADRRMGPHDRREHEGHALRYRRRAALA